MRAAIISTRLAPPACLPSCSAPPLRDATCWVAHYWDDHLTPKLIVRSTGTLVARHRRCRGRVIGDRRGGAAGSQPIDSVGTTTGALGGLQPTPYESDVIAYWALARKGYAGRRRRIRPENEAQQYPAARDRGGNGTLTYEVRDADNDIATLALSITIIAAADGNAANPYLVSTTEELRSIALGTLAGGATTYADWSTDNWDFGTLTELPKVLVKETKPNNNPPPATGGQRNTDLRGTRCR